MSVDEVLRVLVNWRISQALALTIVRVIERGNFRVAPIETP